jgi:CheY-like chemotaxis protein
MATVLIVEDDIDTRDLFARMVTRDGHNVRLACNGWEGLLAMEHNVDLILLDIMMPGMDGVTFLKNLRCMREGREVPVVVVTARDPEEVRLKVARHDVKAILPKGGSNLFKGLCRVVQTSLDGLHARTTNASDERGSAF